MFMVSEMLTDRNTTHSILISNWQLISTTSPVHVQLTRAVLTRSPSKHTTTQLTGNDELSEYEHQATIIHGDDQIRPHPT